MSAKTLFGNLLEPILAGIIIIFVPFLLFVYDFTLIMLKFDNLEQSKGKL
jgi:hypothetical protein